MAESQHRSSPGMRWETWGALCVGIDRGKAAADREGVVMVVLG